MRRAPVPSKPPGMLVTAVRNLARKLARPARRWARAAARATAPYATTLVLVVTAAMWLHHPALAWAGSGAVLATAAGRFREHYGWMRKGSWLATRRRRRHLGPATFRELRRKVSVPVVRRDAKGTRPGWQGPARTMPATEAGIPICVVTRGQLR